MSDPLNKWLTHHDAVHRGWTPCGIANAVCATRGFSFPRVGGGYNLYRRRIDGGVDAPEMVCGAAGATAREIATFPWVRHEPDTSYIYCIRSIGGGGVESETADGTVEAEFDASGGLKGVRPGSPTGLRVRPLAGGRFEVRWSYGGCDPYAAPAVFRVYGGSEPIDFGSPLGEVPFAIGRQSFGFVTDGYPHDAACGFAVRAVTECGMDDGNVVVVRARADAQGPPVAAGVVV